MMKRMLTRSLWLLALAVPTSIFAVVALKPAKYPVEAGPAKFFRDHDQAMAEAKKTGKPVFAFFQEIPG